MHKCCAYGLAINTKTKNSVIFINEADEMHINEKTLGPRITSFPILSKLLKKCVTDSPCTKQRKRLKSVPSNANKYENCGFVLGFAIGV